MLVLVKRAQRGDQEAFVQLMEAHKEALYRVAKGFFYNEDDIADAMQETILAAFEHLGELRQASYFKTWLTRIMINNCNRIIRQRKRVDVMEFLPDTAQLDEGHADLEFRQLLEGLPKESRILFVLYYGEGFTTREIGEILEMNESTVRSKLRRGREELREQLQAN